MQTLDVKAERLRQRLFDAVRELTEFEHQQSFRIPMPDCDPPRFVAFGTREEIAAIVRDDGRRQQVAGDLGSSTVAKLQRDPDSAPNA